MTVRGGGGGGHNKYGEVVFNKLLHRNKPVTPENRRCGRRE